MSVYIQLLYAAADAFYGLEIFHALWALSHPSLSAMSHRKLSDRDSDRDRDLDGFALHATAESLRHW